MNKTETVKPADLASEREHFSDTHYDPVHDEFNPADELAYKLWKAVIFSFGRWSPIYFSFALWLWYKIQQNASSLSESGLCYYFRSIIFIIFIIVTYAWVFLWRGLL